MSGINQNNFDINLIKALGSDIRIEILNLLGTKEMNVNEIANKASVSRPTISHHLLLMKRAGILSSRKQGKETFYSVNMQSITSLAQMLLKFVSTGSF